MKLTHKILGIAFIMLVLSALVLMIKIKMEVKQFKHERTIGNQQWEELNVPLTEFDELEAGEHFVVKWHRGSPAGKINVESNLKNYIKIEQNGTHIRIYLDSIHNYKTHGDIVVNVYSGNLKHIRLYDFVEFQALDTLQSIHLQVHMSDHSEARLISVADSLSVSLEDFSELRANGRSAVTRITQMDHSECDASDFQTQVCEADLKDFSSARIKVANQLKADCSDHSEFRYAGDQVRVESNQRDFATIEKFD